MNIYEIYEKEYNKLPKENLKEKSQFFTPIKIAQQMMEDMQFEKKDEIFILDPCCGYSILTIAFLEKIFSSAINIKKINIDLIDIDNNCLIVSQKILKTLSKEKININIICLNTNFLSNDFENKKYDYIIANPPFKKIKAVEKVEYNNNLLQYINGQPNIYHLFIAKSLKLLNKKGTLILISPKNYLSGKYTEPLRTFILKNYSLIKLHTFDERKKIFKNILQEVCISHIKNIKSNDITLSFNGNIKFTTVISNILIKNESNIVLTPRTEEEILLIHKLTIFKNNKKFFKFKPGQVVQFRTQNNLSSDYFENIENGIPLLVPRHINKNFINYKKINKKNDYITIVYNEETKNILIKNKKYIIIKKNVEKQEKMLLKSAIYTGEFSSRFISIDNNLGYIEFDENIDDNIFYGTFCILNSQQFNDYYKMINGSHTINSYEFENLNFPNLETTKKIGIEFLKFNLDLSLCDRIFDKYIINE